MTCRVLFFVLVAVLCSGVMPLAHATDPPDLPVPLCNESGEAPGDPDGECMDPILDSQDGIDASETGLDADKPFDISASGAFDGIYQCVLTTRLGPVTSYASVNGRANGETAFIMVALDPAQDFVSGHGRGRIVDDVFSGTTSAGRAFRFQMAALDPDSDGNLDQGQVTGSIELLFKIKDRASEFHAFPLTCQSIY